MVGFRSKGRVRGFGVTVMGELIVEVQLLSNNVS